MLGPIVNVVPSVHLVNPPCIDQSLRYLHRITALVNFQGKDIGDVIQVSFLQEAVAVSVVLHGPQPYIVQNTERLCFVAPGQLCEVSELRADDSFV